MKVFGAVRVALYAGLTAFLVLKVRECFVRLEAAELTSSQDMVRTIHFIRRITFWFVCQMHKQTTVYPSVTFCRFMRGIKDNHYRRLWVRNACQLSKV